MCKKTVKTKAHKCVERDKLQQMMITLHWISNRVGKA